MKVLAISGSLRAASINSALLRAAARLAPPGMLVTSLSGIGDLPLFNPDFEPHVPPPVAALYAAVAAADALLIASPEYAHGITGTIKNALDWLVSVESFVCKPVAVLNASPRASRGRGAAGDAQDHVGRHRRGGFDQHSAARFESDGKRYGGVAVGLRRDQGRAGRAASCRGGSLVTAYSQRLTRSENGVKSVSRS